MTAASGSHVVMLRSGHAVLVRQVRAADALALDRAYASLGEQSRYKRFFAAMPELPEAMLKTATEVDHENHEALIAIPLPSGEIVGECRFVRRPGRSRHGRPEGDGGRRLAGPRSWHRAAGALE